MSKEIWVEEFERLRADAEELGDVDADTYARDRVDEAVVDRLTSLADS